MPSQLDNPAADSTSKHLFTISDDKETSLTMSITQSNSFGSAQMPDMNMDGPDLNISLSASSDSIDFDANCTELNLKGTFGNEFDDKKDSNNIFDDNCEVSVVSSGGGPAASADISIASARKDESKTPVHSAGQLSAQKSKSYASQGPPQLPPHPQGYHVQHYGTVSAPTTSHYHPHYQRQYYPNSGSVPQFPGGQAQQYDHRYPPNGPPPGSFNAGSTHPPFVPGMPYQQTNFHQHYVHHSGYPLHGYRHGPLPPSASSNNSSNSRQFASNSNSSAMSVSSNGSRKRTIEGLAMHDDAKNSSFTRHRCSSNSSIGSSGTTGNNTSSETINNMICESPMKRERISTPDKFRRDSSESGTNLSFSGLSMGAAENGKLLLLVYA